MATDPEQPTPDKTPKPEESPATPTDFNRETLARTVIAIPLLRMMEADRQATQATGTDPAAPQPARKLYAVIIDLNLRYSGGRVKAAKKVADLLKDALKSLPDLTESRINKPLSHYSKQYIFAWLHADVIQKIVAQDVAKGETDSTRQAIHRVWPDFPMKAFLNKSISTIKADAAHLSYSASGKDITWAVMDSGIDHTHRHFKQFSNLHPDATYHLDFVTDKAPFQDDFGHGTHVAGIIAGAVTATAAAPIVAVTQQRDENDNRFFRPDSSITAISGMAPQCKLVSMKVLNAVGDGNVSSLIAAISHIQEINGNGRDIKIHGVNMSLGYPFDPEWFACGQSPLCVEVNQLVKSGVVVVVAAGNTGYGITQSAFGGTVAAGVALSINDPGNAELAITVGSTHREMPHTYGVSYFSSKGPTGDGRMKPDLLAPGEKIISCAAGAGKNARGVNEKFEYVEDSGTSMAAPHVSGVIAAFLSIRREFIGQPETVKDLFLTNATDLKRDRNFQGHGLIDLMRTIQSI